MGFISFFSNKKSIIEKYKPLNSAMSLEDLYAIFVKPRNSKVLYTGIVRNSIRKWHSKSLEMENGDLSDEEYIKWLKEHVKTVKSYNPNQKDAYLNFILLSLKEEVEICTSRASTRTDSPRSVSLSFSFGL